MSDIQAVVIIVVLVLAVKGLFGIGWDGENK